MKGYPEPLDMIELVEKHKRLDCKMAAEKSGFSYARCRTVLERLDDEGLVTKIQRGRRFHFEPAAKASPLPGLDAIDESNAPRRAPRIDCDKESASIAYDDDRVWLIRDKGKMLGEVAQLRMKSARYQVIMPWHFETFDTFGDAVDFLKKKVDSPSAIV